MVLISTSHEMGSSSCVCVCVLLFLNQLWAKEYRLAAEYLPALKNENKT